MLHALTPSACCGTACRHQGCSDAACPHCRYSSTRRCSSDLRFKYVSGEPVLAGCGAAPEVQLVNAASGASAAAGQLLLPGWQLQVSLQGIMSAAALTY
jgi:hypothetical protein